ncbi:hypothetical protein [Pectinatus frisingensis]|uniref:hypothetical protein n=1 Tax=Pectinatus frisingensis TaxID=865 RepID=UPI0018C763A1|nr:hypothetical protein [Pectinatus frisingensis]
MKRILLIVLLLYMTSSTVFAQVYTDPQNISITIPDNWKVIKSNYISNNNLYDTFLSGGKEQFIYLVSIYYPTMPKSTTLYNYSDAQISGAIYSMFGKMIGSGTVTNKPNYTKTMVNGTPAVASYITAAAQNGTPLVGIIYMVLKNKKLAFVIYVTTPGNAKEFIPTIDKSINTLEIN